MEILLHIHGSLKKHVAFSHPTWEGEVKMEIPGLKNQFQASRIRVQETRGQISLLKQFTNAHHQSTPQVNLP
jgi:hypothetical protein